MSDDFTKNITDSIDSIKYPINVYGDVKNASRLSVDIGGSLAKLVYLVEDEEEMTPQAENGKSGKTKPKKILQMRFLRFPTKYIEECLNFIQQYLITSKFSIKTQTISATGGGAVKYSDLIKNKLGLKIIKEDEIDCIIKGCVFLLKHVKNECFTYNKEVFPCYTYHDLPPESHFPFLLVNIGSGVSMIKVESNDKYERVGGTSLGGGTFSGLGSLLTSASDFDELLKLADDGNNTNVDMLVKDIYGGNYDLLGLPGDLLASSFGKMIRFKKDNMSATDVSYSQADIAKGLLNIISNTIGQLAYLYARIHNLNKIFFGGYFTRNHTTTLHSLSNAVRYYSKGQQAAYFFRHEGFFGALGAYTNGLNRDIEQRKHDSGHSADIPVNTDHGIFVENIASSSYKEYDVVKQFHPLNVVSLDFTTDKVSAFPNLESSSEAPIDAVFFKEYIKYIEDGIDLFIEELKHHFIVDDKQFSKLTKNFVFMLKRRLECFKEDCPSSFNHFYALWDLRDNFIKEYLLIDPFLKLKHDQNFEAIDKFQPYINTIDSIENIHDRFQVILDNLFAGNLIDISSTEFLKYKKSNPNLNHSDYLKMIKSTKSINTDRSLDDFIGKFTSGNWKKVVIFVDNSGYDIIFGVYGLVREFLKIGATVVLIANTYPSFNDVVSSELTILASRLKKLCPVLNHANDVSLFYGQTGFGSSCLDLKAITSQTCEICNGCDLVIIEGQSRCLVNNFDAKFKCDSLKLGTCTSEILARKYHFKLFDTFFKLDFA